MKKKKTKAMTFKQLVWFLTQVEGGKVQVNAAQMTEVLSRLKTIFDAAPKEVLRVLVK